MKTRSSAIVACKAPGPPRQGKGVWRRTLRRAAPRHEAVQPAGEPAVSPAPARPDQAAAGDSLPALPHALTKPGPA